MSDHRRLEYRFDCTLVLMNTHNDGLQNQSVVFVMDDPAGAATMPQ